MKENAFNPRVVAGLVSAGILAFAAFLFLFAYAGDLGRGHDGRAHALSVSAIGFQGLVRLIERQGGSARMIRTAEEEGIEDLLVITLEDPSDGKAFRTLLDAREGRPTLIVLPKWWGQSDPMHSAWVKGGTAYPAFVTQPLLKPLGAFRIAQARVRGKGATVGRDILDGYRGVSPPTLQSISGEGLHPLLTGPGGLTLLARFADGPTYILAEPDLLNNKGLKDPAAARAALALLDGLNATGAHGVAFDLTLNGFGRKPGLLKLAFEPPFLALTLAIFVAALLAGLHGAFRFGAPEAGARAVALGKAALVENSAGLLRIARREHRTGAAYADLIREAAGHEAGAGLQGEALDLYLDRVSPPDAPFSALAERAREAGDRHALVAAARSLFSWKKDLIK
ncbi:MAG: hypothetical protein JWP15_2993 [Alphaproteobacteria bacterium]|nr:hypothetical protein [Alphaproteobacteria bacterium]